MYSFSWKGSYLSLHFFECMLFGARIELILRTAVSDYEIGICSGGAPYADRFMRPCIGKITRSGRPDQPLPMDLVEAFNDWRQQQHTDQRAKMLAEPNRYTIDGVHIIDSGQLIPLTDWLDSQRPKEVSAVHLVRRPDGEHGWVQTGPIAGVAVAA